MHWLDQQLTSLEPGNYVGNGLEHKLRDDFTTRTAFRTYIRM